MKRTDDNWKEIEDMNKEFAKFLGYQYIPYKEGVTTDKIGWIMPDKFVHLKVSGYGIGTPYLCRRHKQLAFHRDWNWLMEVVGKVAELGFHVMINSWTSIYFKDSGSIGRVELASRIGYSKKENTYRALYEFVENYNKQNETEITKGESRQDEEAGR